MQNRPFLILKKDSIREMILEEQIVYATVKRNYIQLRLIDDRILSIRKSLQQFQQELTPNLFIRIHKRYIVCIRCVKFVDTEITMVIGDPLPIGREYRDEFFSYFRLC